MSLTEWQQKKFLTANAAAKEYQFGSGLQRSEKLLKLLAIFELSITEVLEAELEELEGPEESIWTG